MQYNNYGFVYERECGVNRLRYEANHGNMEATMQNEYEVKSSDYLEVGEQASVNGAVRCSGD